MQVKQRPHLLQQCSASPRAETLRAARTGLLRTADEVKRAIPVLECGPPAPDRPDAIRLTLTLADNRIQVEASPVMRGAVWRPETRRVTAAVEEPLGYSENRLLFFHEIHAGRQHPRDLFDFALLLENEGISRGLLKNLLGLSSNPHLPTVRWKLLNLGRMSASRHSAAVARLRRVLEAGTG